MNESQKFLESLRFSDLRLKYGYMVPLSGMETLSDEEESRQIGAAKYIDSLGSVTGKDIDHLPVKLFLNDRNRLYVDRTKINEIFFKWTETQQEPEIFGMNEELKGILKHVTHKMLHQAREQVAMKIRTCNTKLIDLHYKAQIETGALAAARMTKRYLHELRAIDLVDQINKINKMGFWTLSETVKYSNSLVFKTKDVVLTYYNEKQGRDNTVNLGRFLGEIQFVDGKIHEKVYPNGNNPYSLAYFHPHIATNNVPCYGNLQINADGFRSDLNLFELMGALQSVLTNYNEDSAYQLIHSFEEAFSLKHFSPQEEDPDPPEEDPDENYDEDQDYFEDPPHSEPEDVVPTTVVVPNVPQALFRNTGGTWTTDFAAAVTPPAPPPPPGTRGFTEVEVDS